MMRQHCDICDKTFQKVFAPVKCTTLVWANSELEQQYRDESWFVQIRLANIDNTESMICEVCCISIVTEYLKLLKARMR